jgi:type IV pilus assembly protein PilW
MKRSIYPLWSGLPKNASQKGVGLLELMIGVALGLIILSVLLKVIYMSSVSSAASNNLNQMQESGNSALDFMGYAIRQAGTRSNPNYNVYGLNYADTISGTNGNGLSSDTLTVKYEAVSGGELNCGGTLVGVGNLITYTFSVNTNTRQLLCNDGTTTALVAENIENLQVQYGLDSNKDGVIDAFYIDAPTAAQFNEVAVISVSVVVRGGLANTATNNSQTILLNGGSQTRTDGFLRQVFSSTFTVRNRAG